MTVSSDINVGVGAQGSFFSLFDKSVGKLLFDKMFPLFQGSAFPLALRGTRVVFLLLKQFSSKLETEVEVILTPFIKLISGETDGGEPRPGWTGVLAMEIMRG